MPGCSAGDAETPDDMHIDSDAASNQYDSVIEYVESIHIHGVPYEDTVTRFTPTHASILAEYASDIENVEGWSNAIVVMSMVGDSEHVPFLLNFIRQDVDAPADDQRLVLSAKLNATLASGYLLHTTDDPDLLEFLTTAVASFSSVPGYENPAPEMILKSNQVSEFGKMAMMALALSGRHSAAEALEMIREERFVPMDADESRFFDELLETNRLIDQTSLAEYYATDEFE